MAFPFMETVERFRRHIGGFDYKHTESHLSLSDITTTDVSTTKHGLTPKAPNDMTKFLRGDASWATVPALQVVDSSTVNANFANSTENTLYTFTIPAGTFSAGEIFRFTAWGRCVSTLAGADPPDVTLRLKLGATTFLTVVFYTGVGSLASGTQTWRIQGEFSVIIAASSQRGTYFSWAPTGGASMVFTGDAITAAEDLTANKAFAITVQQSTTVAGLVTHFDGSALERIP